MSSSSNSKGKKPTILMLRELHLTPLFIYMVRQEEYLVDASYTLQMYKDGNKIAQTSQITFIEPTELIRCPALQFNSVRFMFNVKTLFDGEPNVKLTLKLQAFAGNTFIELEEFQVHILSYSYQHSRERFVEHKENSIGRINKAILHYSFSAIYEKYKEDVTQYMNLQEQVKEEENEDSAIASIGIVITEAPKKSAQTLVMVQKVAELGVNMLGLPNQSRANSESERSFLQEQPSSIKQMLMQRNAPRSMFFMEDPVNHSAINSTLTEHDIAIEIKQQSSTYMTWVAILISIFLVYYLMHPSRKV